ncbi:MAG TPA: hypothetical protein VK101_03465 [Limnochordia bacterium]|nr:hypothetical protein [Limnochordia bacterium]
MHESLTEKLLFLERLLLRHDYHELMLETRVPQLHQKVLRILRLKEEQIKLLEDLLKETEQYPTAAPSSTATADDM